MTIFLDFLKKEGVKYSMKTLSENLDTVEHCRAEKYENSTEYEPEEWEEGMTIKSICVAHQLVEGEVVSILETYNPQMPYTKGKQNLVVIGKLRLGMDYGIEISEIPIEKGAE